MTYAREFPTMLVLVLFFVCIIGIAFFVYGPKKESSDCNPHVSAEVNAGRLAHWDLYHLEKYRREER